MTALVTIEDACINYIRAGDSRPVEAVAKVCTEVQENERFILLGPSGCGKSSLLSAVAGFVPLTAGEIRIGGTPVGRPSFDRLMVFQEFDQLLPWKTVSGNIQFALHARWPKMKPSKRRSKAERYCEIVGLGGQRHQYPHTLSGGQKQLAAIARSFALEPSLLLMDEPFGSLDAINRDRMQEELLNVWAELKTTLMFVTHDVTEAARIGHRILVLSRGPRSRVRALVENEPMDGNPSESEPDVTNRLRGLLE